MEKSEEITINGVNVSNKPLWNPRDVKPSDDIPEIVGSGAVKTAIQIDDHNNNVLLFNEAYHRSIPLEIVRDNAKKRSREIDEDIQKLKKRRDELDERIMSLLEVQALYLFTLYQTNLSL